MKRFWPHPADSAARPGGDRGIALPMALFVLSILAILALSVVTVTSMDRTMVSDQFTQAKALRSAESGVNEAMSRIVNGQGPNPGVANAARKVVQILLSSAPGAAGADTTLLPTGQPNGQWLAYSSASSGAGALTIEFKTDPARTVIYRYDKTKNPPVQIASGAPIYRITSTGRAGPARKTVVAEAIWMPISPNLRGAVAAGMDVKFTGNAIGCGFDHRDDTPAGTGNNGRTGFGGCAENLAAIPPRWEWLTGSVAGVWSTGDASGGGASNAYGTPPTSSNNPTFYAGPWEALGMSQSSFYSLVGSPTNLMPATPSGITYLDNDATKQNAAGSWTLNGGTGFLYADGDLTLRDNFRGIVYVEGDLKLNGNVWVLGAVIAKGKTSVKFNGGATVLYSKGAISKYFLNSLPNNRKPTVLSWAER